MESTTHSYVAPHAGTLARLVLSCRCIDVFTRFQRFRSQASLPVEATDYDTKMAQLQAQKIIEQQQQMADETRRRSEVNPPKYFRTLNARYGPC